jgi:dTDP-4-dehydrorhamnose reductase
MKILVFGSNGQVGSALKSRVADRFDTAFLTRRDVDLTQAGSVASCVEAYRPTHIINAAAFTAVDDAEEDFEQAFLINENAVQEMANAAKIVDASVIHYSTDYVFDGTSARPYVESDATNPLGVYGQSKLAGEYALKKSGCRHVVFRTSWVISSVGKNFVKTILRLAKTKDTLNVVSDQVGAVTSADLIARTTIRYLTQQSQIKGGDCFHLTASGSGSWFDVATYCVKKAVGAGHALKLDPEHIMPIPAADYPTKAQRPGNSRLDTSKLQSVLNETFPTWQECVDNTIERLSREGFFSE